MKGAGGNKYSSNTALRSTNSSGVPSKLTITLSTLFVICILFLYSTYYFHLTISSHPSNNGNNVQNLKSASGNSIFVSNRIYGFHSLNSTGSSQNSSRVVMFLLNSENIALIFACNRSIPGQEWKKSHEKMSNST